MKLNRKILIGFILILSIIFSQSVSAQGVCLAYCGYGDPLCTNPSECVGPDPWNACDPCYTPSVTVLPSGDCDCTCVAETNCPPAGGCATDRCPITPDWARYLGSPGYDEAEGACSIMERCDEYTECRSSYYKCISGGIPGPLFCVYQPGKMPYGAYVWVDPATDVVPENDPSLNNGCGDGHDNDCDGRIDEEDTDCDSTAPTITDSCGGACSTSESSITVTLTPTDPNLKEVRYCYSDGTASGDSTEIAMYDNAVNAPKCLTGGSPCTTVYDPGPPAKSLITGRNGEFARSQEENFWYNLYNQDPSASSVPRSLSPREPNEPNTIDDCRDWGNSALGQVPENLTNAFIEHIKVWVGDYDINPGETFNYEVKADCNSTSDKVYVFYTSNASSPSWSEKKGVNCPGTGFQYITGSFALSGNAGYHAVRAVIAKEAQGTWDTASCPGLTNGNAVDSDVDDLVFNVISTVSGCVPTIKLSPYQLTHWYYDGDKTVRYRAWDKARNESAIGSYTVTFLTPSTAECPCVIIRRGASDVKAKIGSNGVMEIEGQIKSVNGVGWVNPSGNDDFVIKNSSGTINAWIDGSTGGLYLKGSLNRNQGALSPPGSGNLIIKNSAGTVVAYFTSSGALYLMDELVENSSI
ncbi:MAG: hypothetical protein ABIE23_05775 [archaeon]